MLKEEIQQVREIAREIAKEEIALALKLKKPAPEFEHHVTAEFKKGGK